MSQVLVFDDDALKDARRTVEQLGWLTAGEPVSVWHSRTAQSVADSGVRITSPFFTGGTRLPDLWLRPGRLVFVCELRPDPVWVFRGAMAAQAEPLLRVWPLPGFRTAQALCEAQRVGAADLVLLQVHTGQGSRWLVGRSALELDRLIARWAGLDPKWVPHLALWQRHFLNPADVESAEPLHIHLSRASVAGVANQVASGLCAVADARADLARGWANRHRIPTFLRKRLARVGG
jgi:hypothetical protein